VSAVNVATLLTALTPSPSGLALPEHPGFREILQVLSRVHLSKLDAFGLASVSNSLLRLKLPAQDPLWQELAAAILVAKPSRFNSQSLGVVVGAYSKLGMAPPGLFEALEPAIVAHLTRLTSLSCANFAAAFHKLRQGSPGLQRNMLLAAITQLTAAKLEELPLIAMNFARAMPAPSGSEEIDLAPLKSLFAGLEQRAVGATRNFDRTGLVNLAWAFGRTGYRSEPLFAEISAQLLSTPQHLSQLRHMEISNLLWAFAKVEVPAPALFERAQGLVISKRSQLEPQHLSNIAWAYSRFDIRSQPLFAALSIEARSKIDGFSPLGLANLTAAFAQLKIYDAPLFRKIEQRASLLVSHFNPSELALIAWGLAEISMLEHRGELDYSKMSLNRRELFRQIREAADAKRDQFRDVHWETLTQALAKVQQPPPPSAQQIEEKERRALAPEEKNEIK